MKLWSTAVMSLSVMLAALVLAVGCSGGGSSGMTWEEFQSALGEDFAQHNPVTITKEELMQKVGKPHTVAEVDDQVWLTYNLRGGMATLKVCSFRWSTNEELVVTKLNSAYVGK